MIIEKFAHSLTVVHESDRRTNGQTFRPTMASTVRKICLAMRDRSTCPEGRRHSAVIMRNNRILSTGYNGPAAGVEAPSYCEMRSDEHGKDFRGCPCVHAEINSIISAARHGISIEGAMMYCTKRPCTPCELACLNAGIRTVIFLED